MTLEDVHQRQDHRPLRVDEVGISGIRYPVVVWDPHQGKQETVAEVSMAVDLAPELKGAHLSRFVEVLHDQAGGDALTPRSVTALAATLRSRLRASTARVEFRFPYFIRRPAPISGGTALMDYGCVVVGKSRDDLLSWELAVRVPVTTVCPCSKAISDYGAHNQRGYVTLAVHPRAETEHNTDLWVEELVDVAEASASAPVRPLVKRPDERYLTMTAFDNPRFVEDVVRNAADALGHDHRIASFSVEAVSDESIHNHAAYARIESGSTGRA